MWDLGNRFLSGLGCIWRSGTGGRLCLAACLLAGCTAEAPGSNAPAMGAASPQGVAASDLFLLDQLPVKLLALPQKHLGVLSLSLGSESPVICPECEPMHLGDQCPAQCRRSTVHYAIYDESGAQVLMRQTLREYVLPSSSHYVGSVQAVVLSNGTLGVASQLCEGPPSRGCALEYATFSAAGQRLRPPIQLYAQLYGDVQLAKNPRSRQVALVRSSTLSVGAGAYVTILDEQGATQRDWTKLGSSQARAAVIAPAGDGFVVATEDWYPNVQEPGCAPCATLFTCGGPTGCAQGRIAPDAGLYTYELSDSGPVHATQVVGGWGLDDLYHGYDFFGVSAADMPVVSAWNRDSPQQFHVFARQDGWQERQTVPAPASVAATWTPSWTRLSVRPDGTLHWVGSIVNERSGQLLSGLFAGQVSVSGTAGAGLTGSSFQGFHFADTLAFGCLDEDHGCAYVVASALGANKDEAGYDHYSVIRLQWP